MIESQKLIAELRRLFIERHDGATIAECADELRHEMGYPIGRRGTLQALMASGFAEEAKCLEYVVVEIDGGPWCRVVPIKEAR